jgi:hypothetical protein
MRQSPPSTSWKQKFRPSEPVKDFSRYAAARSAVLDRLGRSGKEALQEVDGALCQRLQVVRQPALGAMASASRRLVGSSVVTHGAADPDEERWESWRRSKH